MRHLDATTHFFPHQLFDKMESSSGFSGDIAKRMRGVPGVWDIEVRRRVVGRFENYRQILSLGMPPLEVIADAQSSPELAKIGNDGLAALVARHPDCFAGYLAALPMNAPDQAVKEAERAFANGANGLQIHTNINGRSLADPRYEPVFAAAARAGKPILLHPARGVQTADFPADSASRYELWAIFGWPYETTCCMAHLVFSGLMDRVPGLKLVVHHLGAMVPYFEGRIRHGWATLGSRTTGDDPSLLPAKLKRPVMDYFKDFYGDSALAGSASGLRCGLDFFGAERVLFASDCPFDAENGALYIAETIAALASLGLPPATHEAIAFGNAERLFGLAAAPRRTAAAS
jgi:predicted TIM-barrel fold metal-dependent hydrolase